MYSWSFDKDLNKGTLQPSHPITMPTYRIQTKKNFLNNSRKRTELVPFGPSIGGAILWKDKAIAVGGTERKIKKIRGKARGNRHAKEWYWTNTNSPYVVEYKSSDKSWTATMKGNQQPSAVLTRKKSHFLRGSDPAMVTFHASIAPEEVTFLLLVMIYSEIARAERIKEGISTAANVIDVTLNVAGS